MSFGGANELRNGRVLELSVHQDRSCGHNSRVLVLGLDAADLGFIQEFISLGELPTFARLMKMGKVKVLRSTIPDTTSPAWTSIFTGVDPSYHGIYGFSQPAGHKVLLTSVANRRSPAIWNLVDPRCQKVIINIPNTNPAERINGCMIPDSGESAFPEDILPNLRRLGYVRFEPHGTSKRKIMAVYKALDSALEAILQCDRPENVNSDSF